MNGYCVVVAKTDPLNIRLWPFWTHLILIPPSSEIQIRKASIVKMEMKSPPPCPPTVTVRRNPPRKARATPLSAVPLRQPISSPSLSRDIFASELPQNPVSTEIKDADLTTRVLSENLKIYLRIRPLTVRKNSKIKAEPKNAWPKNKKVKSGSRPNTKKCSEVCVEVNEDMRSVTVSTPQALQETKRIKSEVYEGFSHVFASEASQVNLIVITILHSCSWYLSVTVTFHLIWFDIFFLVP